MTHAAVGAEALSEAGIGENLLRLSIGLESSADLITDVLGALEAAHQAEALQPVAVA